MNCVNLSRRKFLLQLGALGILPAIPEFAYASQEAAKVEGNDFLGTPSADRLIILFVGGGMPHTDTFDPKRHTPFQAGIESARVVSTFPAISSVVDHIKLSAGLENIAKLMDRCTLIRSYQAADLGPILHTRHQYHWHTGYVPPQSLPLPHIGAWISRILGPLEPDVPPFMHIGQDFTVQEGEELKSYVSSGFLGSAYSPVLIPEPDLAGRLVGSSDLKSRQRIEERFRLLKTLVKDQELTAEFSPKREHIALLDRAHSFLNSRAARALDLSLEPQKSRDQYGASRFGRGCLLARRLVETGVRVVEVSTRYIPFGNWDMHQDGHTRTISLKSELDPPVAQLLVDLEDRGLLKNTVVILASEFSRDALTEGRPGAEVAGAVDQQPAVISEMKHYGLHRHFTGAGSVLLAGAGFKKGYLHGATADERPCLAIKDPVRIEDLHASLFWAFGISPRTSISVDERPVYVTNNGQGRPIEKLFERRINFQQPERDKTKT